MSKTDYAWRGRSETIHFGWCGGRVSRVTALEYSHKPWLPAQDGGIFTGQVVDAFDQRSLHGYASVLWHCSGRAWNIFQDPPFCRYVLALRRGALGQIDEAKASVYHALKDPDNSPNWSRCPKWEVGSEEN